MSADLHVEFCGEIHTSQPGASLTFGRAADIIIDDNRFLHRVLGAFVHRDGLWWIDNVGSNTARIAPGSSMPLVFTSSTIRFDAGGSNYELAVDLVTRATDHPHTTASPIALDREGETPDDVDDDGIDDDGIDDDGTGDATNDDGGIDDEIAAEMTTTTTSLPLTDEQRQLLEALAAPLLAGADALPTNRQLAASLGWTITKYNRKLDGLCAKYARAGITGLRGSSDQLATDRRLRLAEHVIDSGIVHLPDE